MSFWVSLHAEHGYLFAEEMWVPRIYLFILPLPVGCREACGDLGSQQRIEPGLCSEVKY